MCISFGLLNDENKEKLKGKQMAGALSYQLVTFISENHSDMIHSVLKRFIFEEKDYLDIQAGLIEEIHSVKLDGFRIKTIKVAESADDSVKLTVVVEADLEVKGLGGRDYETESAQQWFAVSLSGQLDDGFNNLTVLRVEEYYKSPFKREQALSPSLVPYFAKDDFDNIAEDFLREFCPEMLSAPMALPVTGVVERMGLRIRELDLSRNLVLFGMMVFGDTSVVYYNKERQCFDKTIIKGGTILVDPNVFFERNLGCWNNTVIHECVHWWKHRKHHEFFRMIDDEYSLVSCRVRETERIKDIWTDEDWMEWHANGIAPRILMPKATVLLKIDEYKSSLAMAFPQATTLETLEYVIINLAEFYHVSKQAAKIRLLDLGYREAEPLFNYIDDHYVGAYSYATGSLDENQTYNISMKDSMREYLSNCDFKELIDSGDFVYVDSHFVVNDKKYVERTSCSDLRLTDYAKLHIDECCIRFALETNKKWKPEGDKYLEDGLFRKAVSDFERVPVYCTDEHNQALTSVAKDSKHLVSMTLEFLEFNKKTADYNFAQTAYAHIERLGISQQRFYDTTLLDDRQFRKLKSGNPKSPSFDTAMAICIGLDLGLEYGVPLLEKAAMSLENKEKAPYKMLLACYRGRSIFECNEFLTEQGAKLLREKEYRSVLSLSP